MLIFAGLGNPGAEHRNNRHNAGFMVLDKLAAGEWAKDEDRQVFTQKLRIEGQDLLGGS